MNKQYQKPVLCRLQVSALENMSAFVFDNFGEFTDFETNVTTYRFSSGFKGGAFNEKT